MPEAAQDPVIHTATDVLGHRMLSSDQVAVLFKVKELREHASKVCSDLKDSGADPRNLAIARTHFEDAFMRINRAVTKPEVDL